MITYLHYDSNELNYDMRSICSLVDKMCLKYLVELGKYNENILK